mgnify:CR=1 FL=1
MRCLKKSVSNALLREVEKVSKQRIYRLAETFRDKLAKNDRVLDLGCCRFDFNQLPR